MAIPDPSYQQLAATIRRVDRLASEAVAELDTEFDRHNARDETEQARDAVQLRYRYEVVQKRATRALKALGLVVD